MIVRLVPATKQVWILSVPRDLWVTIPSGSLAGMNRINAAFNTGPDTLIQTIETDLHIPINHYVAVNFTGLQSMVTAIGGVTMDFSTPVKDAYSGLNVSQTGCQLVPGPTALELVRARHLYYMTQTTDEWKYDGLSDFSRIQRQDAFFRAAAGQAERRQVQSVHDQQLPRRGRQEPDHRRHPHPRRPDDTGRDVPRPAVGEPAHRDPADDVVHDDPAAPTCSTRPSRTPQP